MAKQPPAKRKRKVVMENQRQAKRRREAASGSMEEDRISQLPEPILHHVLSFLPQKDAFGTCILSKSWRHLGPTRPKIEFDERYVPGIFFEGRQNNEKFLSVVEKTLQRYDDQNLPIQEFILNMPGSDSGSISLLNKWVPKVIKNLGLKTFKLGAHDFSLPSVVFEAEFLTELKLPGCKFDQINNCILKLQMLKRLSLHGVCIEEKTFDKIMSSCPLIEHLVLESCEGLSTIKVNKACNLKHFHCYIFRDDDQPLDIGIVEIDDAPSLETIHIEGGYRNFYHHKNNYFSPRLKSLYLQSVNLPTELLNNLSSDNCPCLEKLELHYCSGFSEFKLSNRSIKRLIISTPDRPIKAAIDAANMLYFEFKSNYLPTISFSTTSREWRSQIEVSRSSASSLSTWSLKLYEFLKSLSRSQISLDISYLQLTNKDTYDIGGSCEPLVVEHLCLREYYSSPVLRVLFNCLFHICRPRYIGLSDSPKKNVRKLAESIWKIIVKKGETKFWQKHLEESSIGVIQENAHEWRPGQLCEFLNNEEIRFMLKWRD